MSSVLKAFEASSHLFGANAPFVEELYERYLELSTAGDTQVSKWVVDLHNRKPQQVAAQSASSAALSPLRSVTWVTASLTRARLTRHSRITAGVTWLSSAPRSCGTSMDTTVGSSARGAAATVAKVGRGGDSG